MKKGIYFISGIDTDSGKTYGTGLVGRFLHKKNQDVITMKLVQTGCSGFPDDLVKHRELMGVSHHEVDRKNMTCPYVFKFPASPHLAASLENTSIDINKIDAWTEKLAKRFDYLLIEGAGGLHVPLTLDYTLLDYLKDRKYPVILVTSSRIGSINHTLLSFEAIKSRGLELAGVLYNHYPIENQFVLDDSKKVFKHYLDSWFPDTPLIEMPFVRKNAIPDLPLDKVFGL
ncbi:MAG: dethiobiotin synthase [Hyphomicrobiales bacterium]